MFVTSEIGQGSVFTFILPFKITEKVNIQNENEIELNWNTTPEILLVEDNRINQKVATKILESIDCNVTIADDGQQAVDKFETGEFDLVLMDIQMPVMDGIEATRAIRKVETGDVKIPIVALSASVLQHESKDEYYEAGFNDYMLKPLQPKELIKIFSESLVNLLVPAGQTVTADDLSNESTAEEEPDTASSVSNEESPADNRFESIDNLPLFDKQEALEMLGDDVDFIKTLLECFVEDAPNSLDKLQNAVENADFTQIKEAAHAMKGMGRNLALKRFGEYATKCENAAKNQDLDTIKVLNTKIQQEFYEIDEQMTTLI